MADKFYLPIGFKHNGKDITELPIANTGGDAEKIFTKKPSASKLHTWFAQVIAVAVSEINGVTIASEFIKQEDKNKIPAEILLIPFIDAGTLMMQIQRECWEDMMKNQRLTCVNCGEKLDAEIDLKKIAIPINETGKAILDYTVKLTKTYTINTGIDIMAQYEGFKFNRVKFRVATLGDGINHQEVLKDEVTFWRELAFDTIIGLSYIDEAGEETVVPDGYIEKRGKVFFTRDMDSKSLKEIRKGMQETMPSAKYFYEEDCPICSKTTPFFASVSNFFSS